VAILLHQLDVELRCPRTGGLAVDLASVGEHRFRGLRTSAWNLSRQPYTAGSDTVVVLVLHAFFYLEWVQVRLTDFVEPADPGAKPRLMVADALHRARMRDRQIRCCWRGSV